jgi:hypothetical protein
LQLAVAVMDWSRRTAVQEVSSKDFHRLYGIKKPRISYQRKDFLDYVLMVLVSAAVIRLSYGPNSVMTMAGLALCVLMVVVFPIRHGWQLSMPVILRRPQDVLYMIVYKIQNLSPIYFFAIAVLLLENYFIHLTPNLPHHVELMHEIALWLFYLHFLSISLYRTAILIAHLAKRAHVRAVLMETAWESAIAKQPIVVEIFHAYFTGLLAHLILIAPWYIAITYCQFSIIALPVVAAINVFMHLKFIHAINAWFYRDHWLGHNSELEFLYSHGTHHDAIPCGLIGVAGNGFLEGFLRHALGFPNPFYNPVIAFLFYTIEVKRDIQTHQYIPGVFPKLTRQFQEVSQHSTHHFGRLEPYGFALKLDQPGVSDEFKEGFKGIPDTLKNSIGLDEQLTGFEWHNSRFKMYLELFDKYQK